MLKRIRQSLGPCIILLLIVCSVVPIHAGPSVLYAVPNSPPSTCSASSTPPCSGTFSQPCIGQAASCGNGVQNTGALTGDTITSITFYASSSTSNSGMVIDFGIWDSSGLVEKSDFGHLTVSTVACNGTPGIGATLCTFTETGSGVIGMNDVIAWTAVSGVGVGNIFTYQSSSATSGVHSYDGGVVSSASVFASFSGTTPIINTASGQVDNAVVAGSGFLSVLVMVGMFALMLLVITLLQLLLLGRALGTMVIFQVGIGLLVVVVLSVVILALIGSFDPVFRAQGNLIG